MPVLQKLVAQTMLASLAWGSVVCLCPVEGYAKSVPLEATAQQRHRCDVATVSSSSRHDVHRDHGRCDTDCCRISAGALQSNAVAGARDHTPRFAPIAVSSIAVPDRPPFDLRHAAPDGRQRPLHPPADTPVRRFDRLID